MSDEMLRFNEAMIRDTLDHLSNIELDMVTLAWEGEKRTRAKIIVQYRCGGRNRLLCYRVNDSALSNVDERAHWLSEVLAFVEHDKQMTDRSE